MFDECESPASAGDAPGHGRSNEEIDVSEPMPENWLPIDVCPENYKVSDCGRVWSRPRPRTRGGIMKQSTGQHGVQIVNLTINGKQRVYLVHHLVLVAFVGPCPEGMEGCHNDGNPAN